MNWSHFSSMEEIPLEDEDRGSAEFRVLLVYAQHQLSASKCGRRLEGGREGSLGGEGVPAGNGDGDLSAEEREQPAGKKTAKKSRRKCCLFASCLRKQAGEKRREAAEEDALDGRALKRQGGLGTACSDSQEAQDDSDISLVADRLAEIVNNSRFYLESSGFKGLVRSRSLEEDGGWASKPVSEDAGETDEEEKIIQTIVALLRKSGDELTQKMEKDKTFSRSVSDSMSYYFFKKVADQFVQEAPVNPARDSEAKVQSTRVAFAVEVTTRLTAVDNHPMNMVLGFGTKYLKENFSPWIRSQGGWEKALGLVDCEEVE